MFKLETLRLVGPAAGMVVLVERGGCAFTDKALRLQKAGARAMLLFDNQPGARPEGCCWGAAPGS